MQSLGFALTGLAPLTQATDVKATFAFFGAVFCLPTNDDYSQISVVPEDESASLRIETETVS